MADAIYEAVAIKRELVEGVSQRTALERTLGSFIKRSFYSTSASGASPLALNRLHNAILRQVSREFLPFAREVGRAAAQPILDAIPAGDIATAGSTVRNRAINRLRKFSSRNLAQFKVKLAREVGTLSGDANVAFAEAARDGVAKQRLIDQLLAADRADHARLATVGREIDNAAIRVADAEEALARASNRGAKKAKRSLRDAKKGLQKAKAKLQPSRLTSFYARFETAVQADSRDAVRRESEAAQQAEFLKRGYTSFVWVAVNGSDACPSCQDRHGGTYTAAQMAADGPGMGGTYCQGACMCVMTPEEFAVGNETVANPLTIMGNRREARGPVPTLNAAGRSTGRPPAAIKLGGKNSELAKEAKKRGTT